MHVVGTKVCRAAFPLSTSGSRIARVYPDLEDEAGPVFQPPHCLSVGVAVRPLGHQFLPCKWGPGVVSGLPAFLDCRRDEGKVELQLRARELVLSAQRSTGSGVWRPGTLYGLATESSWNAGPAGFPFVTGPSHRLPLASDSGLSTSPSFMFLSPPSLGSLVSASRSPHSSLGRGHG